MILEWGGDFLGSGGWKRDLWIMCSPKTGSPDGIATVINLADNVITQIQKLIGVTAVPTKGSPSGPVTPINDLNTASGGAASAKPKKSVYKLQYWFTNAIFDANQLKGTGFHYLRDPQHPSEPRGPGGDIGAKTIRSSKFKNRIRRETLKYFFTEDPAVAHNRADMRPGVHLIDFLAATSVSDYTYLAPSEIQSADTRRRGGATRQGGYVSLLPEPPTSGFPSATVLSALASDILNIKSPPNEPKKIPVPRSVLTANMSPEERSKHDSRIVRDNLTEVLADVNCTVELPLRAVGGTTPRPGHRCYIHRS